MRAEVQLFKDQVSNTLAKASHPSHSGGCSHLLNDEPRYREQVRDKKGTLPEVTG